MDTWEQSTEISQQDWSAWRVLGEKRKEARSRRRRKVLAIVVMAGIACAGAYWFVQRSV